LGGFRAQADDSPGVAREVENDNVLLRKVTRKGVEMADAGSLHSRRRVSTGGAENPLPMVRLPERSPLRNKPLLGEIRKCLQGWKLLSSSPSRWVRFGTGYELDCCGKSQGVPQPPRPATIGRFQRDSRLRPDARRTGDIARTIRPRRQSCLTGHFLWGVSQSLL
jgi:hypothetical protein